MKVILGIILLALYPLALSGSVMGLCSQIDSACSCCEDFDHHETEDCAACEFKGETDYPDSRFSPPTAPLLALNLPARSLLLTTLLTPALQSGLDPPPYLLSEARFQRYLL